MISHQEPSTELRTLRERVAKYYRAWWWSLIVGIPLLAISRYDSLFIWPALAVFVAGAGAFNIAFFFLGQRLQEREHHEFGTHSDPHVRALIRGEITLPEYAARTAPTSSPNDTVERDAPKAARSSI